MLLGRLFHSVGPIYEKARSPYVLVLLGGTSSSRIDDGLSSRPGFLFFSFHYIKQRHLTKLFLNEYPRLQGIIEATSYKKLYDIDQSTTKAWQAYNN